LENSGSVRWEEGGESKKEATRGGTFSQKVTSNTSNKANQTGRKDIVVVDGSYFMGGGGETKKSIKILETFDWEGRRPNFNLEVLAWLLKRREGFI